MGEKNLINAKRYIVVKAELSRKLTRKKSIKVMSVTMETQENKAITLIEFHISNFEEI